MVNWVEKLDVTGPTLAVITAKNSVEFRRKFDLMALQRNLKALGTFGFQKTVRGNSSYVQHIPRTLRYVRANLARYPRFLRLRDLLSEHCKELQ